MNSLPFLTAALLVWFPYALTMEPNGSLRMAIARWAEKKGTDLDRVVRQLDNSQTKLEPNEPYVVHRKGNPLSRDETSEIIYTQKFTKAGTRSLDHMFTKKLSTTWTWSRKYNMDYVLNVSQPAYIKVPDDSRFHVKSLHKDFWEFKTPLPWDEAKETCRAAGLKLAQPKTQMEVEKLRKRLHKRIHNRESGCQDEAWKKKNGYCLIFNEEFDQMEDASSYCKSINSVLPFPALGDVTAWQEAIMDSLSGRSSTHSGAVMAPDGQWLWEDDNPVQDEAWTSGNPDERGECAVITPATGKLIDKDCSTTWTTLCQGHSSTHWLGAIGSDDKCVEWNDGKCIEEEDYDPNSNIDDLWQTGQPGDFISSDYALQLHIENEKPFAIRKITERSPFLCESACPLGFNNFGPQCLLVQKVWVTWRDAQAACVNMGLQLFETEEESQLEKFLHDRRIIGTYWIGGSERNVAGKEARLSIIEKLPFICELPHGTRKMNVTNQLSYSDKEKVKLPKVVTETSNCTVEVKEKTIKETYPFSVQMDITGWIWVEYFGPTDEHGGKYCDNNNDWVIGEWCWAHSKWGYSTSYLQDGDQIMAQGENARLTLNGTVTYLYNEHEISTKQCGSDRESRSIRERKLRRSKRSVESLKRKSKNYKAKDNNIDDYNKPLMSSIGKRAGDWVRALAQEKKAHLVAYTIDQLSPTVTDMKMEKEISELLSPGSIFEEEFENTGTEPVINVFSKRKNVANSYRWSVSKGLTVEDSHVASYSIADTQRKSNTFSLSNNIGSSEGISQSSSLSSTDSLSSSEGGSLSEAIGSSNTDSITDSQSSSQGGTTSVGTSQTDSEGNKISSSVSLGEGSKVGGSQSTGVSDKVSSSDTHTSGTSASSGTTDTQSNTVTDTDSTSQSSTQGVSQSSSQSQTNSQSSTQTDTTSTTERESTETSKTKGGGFSFIFSVKSETTKTTRNEKESTRTSENSRTQSSEATNSRETSVNNENTSTNEQSTASETGLSSQQSNTLEQTDTNESSVGQDQTKTSDVSSTHEESKTKDSTSTQDKTTESELGQTVDNSQNYDDTTGIDQVNTVDSSRNKEIVKNYEKIHGKDNTYSSDNSIDQDRSKNYERSHGGDVGRDLETSQEDQKTHTHRINLDRNEEVESSEDESLHTESEVTIPPKTNVKIEWRMTQRKVRLPWKASIHLTGWVNVRFKNDDQECDLYDGSGWTYNYTSLCKKDNRLYGYPLSYLKDENFIQQGSGLRFVASGMFEAVLVSSHYLRVTETPLEGFDPDWNKDSAAGDDYDYTYDDNSNNTPDDYDNQPTAQRRKRDLTRRPSKVTDYHLEFDEHGTARANIG